MVVFVQKNVKDFRGLLAGVIDDILHRRMPVRDFGAYVDSIEDNAAHYAQLLGEANYRQLMGLLDQAFTAFRNEKDSGRTLALLREAIRVLHRVKSLREGEVQGYRDGVKALKSTPVMFRVDRDGTTFAIFPTEPSDRNPANAAVYDAVGGHTGGNLRGLVSESKPATPDQYRQIKLDIERGYPGYGTLEVVNRIPADADRIRREKIGGGGKSVKAGEIINWFAALQSAKEALKGARVLKNFYQRRAFYGAPRHTNMESNDLYSGLNGLVMYFSRPAQAGDSAAAELLSDARSLLKRLTDLENLVMSPRGWSDGEIITEIDSMASSLRNLISNIERYRAAALRERSR